jgi:hypothetical protein
MKKIFLPILLACCSILSAQVRTDIGINLTPLLLNNLDLQAEWQFTESFSLVANTGLRYQTLNPEAEAPIRVLGEYVHPSNFGTYFAVGGRWFNHEVNEYQYPFIQVGLVGSYYEEDIFTRAADGNLTQRNASGVRLGLSTTIGFVIRITQRAHLDLAMQMAFTKAREDLLNYYMPGMGYTTYGLDAISIKGAHFQPRVVFKYNIRQTKRQRIHNMK